MKAARIVAAGAISALGEGAAAVDPRGEPAIRTDAELARIGLRKARVALAVPPEVPTEPAEWLLTRALDQLTAQLDALRPAWRAQRVVSIVGTSSGGMWSQTRAFDALRAGEASSELCRAAPYWGPLDVLRRALHGAPIIQILTACASSAMALGLAREVLEHDLADLVIAGGYDALTPFVAAGFEALGVTTADLPLPFSLLRDGLALGEGAALIALARDDGPGAWLTGFGASADASHPTSPAQTGDALLRAAEAALAEARHAGPFLLSAHATATAANDRAEAAVIGSLGARVEAVHAFKSRIGHTLGAGSVLELMSALRCVDDQSAPALGPEPLEPALGEARLQAQRVASRCVLKLASAFGGANAALVAGFERPNAASPAEPDVVLAACGAPCLVARVDDLIARSALDPIHVRRLDGLSALCCTAALQVLPPELDPRDDGEVPRGYAGTRRIGVVVGSVLGSMEHNAAYQARLVERGHGRADPRKFPGTSPNLAPGMISILFGLGGPCTSVGAGYEAPFEALLVAIELLHGGHADEMLVVAADDRGRALDALLECAGAPAPAHGALALRLSAQRQEGTPHSVLGLRADILARLTSNSDTGWPSNEGSRAPGPAEEQAGWPALSAWLKDKGLQGP